LQQIKYDVIGPRRSKFASKRLKQIDDSDSENDYDDENFEASNCSENSTEETDDETDDETTIIDNGKHLVPFFFILCKHAGYQRKGF